MSRWAWIAMIAMGCGQPSSAQSPKSPGAGAATPAGSGSDAGVAAPRTLADDLPRLASRARQLYLDWQTAFSDASLDCATAAARMNEIADRNADLIAANQAVLRAGHARVEAFRAELARYEDEINGAARAVMESPIMGRCVQDAAFGQAIDRLAGEG